MQGAREYATLFQTGQHGRLFLVSSSHARGKTFRIFVLPEGEEARPNGAGTGNAPLNLDAIEVYGITSGQPGWTETYGWLHAGRWQQDFEKLVEARRAGIAAAEEAKQAARQSKDAQEALRRAALLANY
jgi:hypothetical protein